VLHAARHIRKFYAMPAEPNSFRVLTTAGYERDLRTISRGRPSAVDAMEELLAILRRDPYNRHRQHQIKKLTACKVGEGQWRIRWKQYRLRYDIVGSDVLLYSFRHRKEAY
jgi:mRNA-degrading endonuclease RelE of RelBE toxin-antitoxin system